MAKETGEIKSGEITENHEPEKKVSDDLEQGDTIENTDDEGTDDENIEDEGINDEDEENQEKETWMLTDDESQEMPVAAHVRIKHKLKGRLAEKDDEIERLKAEIESIRTNQMQPATIEKTPVLSRPDPLDFNTDEEYNQALDVFEEKVLEQRYSKLEAKRAYDSKLQAINVQRQQEVDKHYDRAAKLISDSGIDADVYRDADMRVRRAVESLMPKQGDTVTDHIISLLGAGSEKVMFYLGRNDNALNKFKVLLSEDASGLRAAIYLGEEKTRLASPSKLKSSAPKPGRKISGDTGVTDQTKAGELKKKYDKAHKQGNIQEAYNIKRKAKLSGVQTVNW